MTFLLYFSENCSKAVVGEWSPGGETLPTPGFFSVCDLTTGFMFFNGFQIFKKRIFL